MYRVTYSQRFLPPVSNAAAIVPQITPVMAVPVTNPAANFLFQPAGSTEQHNTEQKDIISRALGTSLASKDIRDAKPLDSPRAAEIKAGSTSNVEVAVSKEGK